jgi:hypothetical protein
MIEHHPYFKLPEDHNAKIWRFLTLAKFLSTLESRSLHFARSDQFEDPYEGAIPERVMDYARSFFHGLSPDNADSLAKEYLHVIDGLRLFSYLNCWHVNQAESDAMWRIYSHTTECVAIQSTVARLCDCLGNTDEKVFVGQVIYTDFETVPPDIFLNGLTPFIHKRSSFEYERELRALLWLNATDDPPKASPGEVGLTPGPLGRRLPVNLDVLIEEVVVAPFAPGWFVELVSDLVARYNAKWRLSHSRLYRPPNYRHQTSLDVPRTPHLTQNMIENLDRQHLLYTEASLKERERLAQRQHEAILQWYEETRGLLDSSEYVTKDGKTIRGRQALSAFAATVPTLSVDEISKSPMFQHVYLLSGRFDNLRIELCKSSIPGQEKKLLIKRVAFLYTDSMPVVQTALFKRQDFKDYTAGMVQAMGTQFVKFLSYMQTEGV